MTTELLDSIVSSNSQELPNASSALKLFENPQFRVRVVMRDGEPWFVAKDVCDCLELGNVSQTCSRLDDDERGIILNDTPSGKQEMLVVSEPGLYSLIGSSKKQEAKAFKRWVNHEVLPSIRKTGGYGIRTVDDMINDPDTAIRLLTQLKILRLQNDQLEMERDEAIRTKAMIGSRREATAMNTASKKSKECEKLREQIGDSKTYKRATAIPWLSEYFDTRNDGLYNSLAAQLKKVEASMPSEFAHKPSPDSRFGSVKAYHIAVIERFHEIVREKIPVDKKFMAKYRKDVSSQSEND